MHPVLRRATCGLAPYLRRHAGTGPSSNPHADVKQILFSERTIAERVQELGASISADYSGADKPLLLVGTLTGSAVFTADLIREIACACPCDCVVVIGGSAGCQWS